jgi:hypothetical protein
MSTAPLKRSLQDLEFSVGRRLAMEQHQAWTCAFSGPQEPSSCPRRTRPRPDAGARYSRRRVSWIQFAPRRAPEKRTNTTVGLLAKVAFPGQTWCPRQCPRQETSLRQLNPPQVAELAFWVNVGVQMELHLHMRGTRTCDGVHRGERVEGWAARGCGESGPVSAGLLLLGSVGWRSVGLIRGLVSAPL